MKVSIHSLYWNNTAELAELHKSVTKHLDIPVHYHNADGMPHGYFCNEVMRLADTDIVGLDRKSTRLNSSHIPLSRMPSSA